MINFALTSLCRCKLQRIPEFRFILRYLQIKLITAYKSDYVIRKVVKLSNKLLFQKRHPHLAKEWRWFAAIRASNFDADMFHRINT